KRHGDGVVDDRAAHVLDEIGGRPVAGHAQGLVEELAGGQPVGQLIDLVLDAHAPGLDIAFELGGGLVVVMGHQKRSLTASTSADSVLVVRGSVKLAVLSRLMPAATVIQAMPPTITVTISAASTLAIMGSSPMASSQAPSRTTTPARKTPRA